MPTNMRMNKQMVIYPHNGILFSIEKQWTLFLKFFIYLSIYFWLHWVLVAMRRPSPVVVSRGYSLLWCVGFSLPWPLLLQSVGSRLAGFSSCGVQAQQLWLMGSRAQAQQLWRTGSVAPWHVGSSWTRAWTRVPCIGRWIPNHCCTREAHNELLIHTTTWVNLKIIIVKERSSQTKKKKRIYSSYIKYEKMKTNLWWQKADQWLQEGKARRDKR